MYNILPDFLTLTPSGLYCSYGDFYLDPQVPVQNAVISHAHGDHARPGNHLIYCTAATQAIMQSRYGKTAGTKFEVKAFNEEFYIKDIQILLFSAGHILGSAQILLTYKGIRYLYTGDYKMQTDFTCEPLQYTQADVLITESTFANPSVRHPDPVIEIQKLNQTPYNILLGTYGLGKAQRLNHLINTYCPEKTVLLHHSIVPIHKIYEKFGVEGLKYKLYDRKVMKHNDKGYVYMVPALTFNSYFKAKNLVKAFASGWEYLQRMNDISLYISDNVDWDDILSYIENVQPKEIWTLHGDGRVLQEHFKGLIAVKILN